MKQKLASGLVLVILASAMGVAQAKAFRWAFQGDAGTLDPMGLYEGMTNGFQGNFYEGLVGRDGDMKVIPLLAERWENTSPTVWRFYLRKGVKFHNGNDFDADDVLFTSQRIRSKGSAHVNLARLFSKIEKIDDHTIDWHTPDVNPILTSQIESFYIMDAEWCQQHGLEVAQGVSDENYAHTHANGTGPFQVIERTNEKTVLKANNDWWGERKHNIDTATFTPIENEDQRVKALTQGKIDLAYPVHVKYWKRLEFNDQVEVLTGAEARTIYLGFDQSRDELLFSNIKGKNPFKDVRVRQAFQKAINLNEIKSRVMRNTSTPTGLMVAPQINGFDATLNTVPKADLRGAKALLQAAGYPHGFEVTLDCPNDRYVNDEPICESVVDMLARVGVKVNLIAQPKSKFFKKVFPSNDYQTSFYLLGWTPVSFDAAGVLKDLIACRSGKSGLYNLGGYCNPKVDELTAQIETEIDQPKRNALIKQAFQIHQQDVGHIPLHQQPLSWGVRAGVSLAQRADNKFHLKHVVLPD